MSRETYRADANRYRYSYSRTSKDIWPPVVTICGPMECFDLMVDAQWRLSLQNMIVMLPVFDENNLKPEEPVHCFNQDGMDLKALSPAELMRRKRLHFAKIDRSDCVYILVVNGRIALEAQEEILYAVSKKKEIGFLNYSGHAFLGVNEFAKMQPEEENTNE